MKRLAVGFIAIALAAPLFAQQKIGFEFKGVYIGMTRAEFASTFAGEQIAYEHLVMAGRKHNKPEYHFAQMASPACNDTNEGREAVKSSNALDDWAFIDMEDEGGVICGVAPDQMVVAGVPMKAMLFRFRSGKLASIGMEFDSGDYQTLADAFKVKYGKTSDSGDLVSYQNVFGAGWKGEGLIWSQGTQRVLLFQGGNAGPGMNPDDENLRTQNRFDGKASIFDVKILEATTAKPTVDF